MKTIRPALLIASLLMLAACSAAGPRASQPPSASPSPRQPSVTSPEQAAARVKAEHPEFAGLTPPNPDLIGACCWYEATAVEGGYQVVVTVGWGDCPAGCIHRHVWTFAVAPEGRVGLIGEDGPPVPAGQLPDEG
jgi:hypothetical protein